MLSGLRCENATNPLGVEAAHPRLSWVFAGGGGVQTAYQVIVASSKEKLNAGEGDLWDSGRVVSNQTTEVPYQGKALSSRQHCYWKVRAWDAFYQPTVYSAAATWEMGLLSPNDWKAKWIGSTPAWDGRALYFRYAFSVRKPVKEARAYIAGIGYHELRIDGTPVSDQVTDDGEQVPYSTSDASGLIREGENVLGVIVGNGCHREPKLLLQVEVSYADGAREQFYTHGGAVEGRIWTVTSGPILSNSISSGVVYDARLEKSGWDLPQGSLPQAEEWVMVQPVEPPGGRLVSQWIKPTIETLRPQKLTEPKPGVFVFDVGRNLNGWEELRVKGVPGTAVTLRFAENLAADGTVDQRRTTDIYILKGGGEEMWEPRFINRSLRYVQVEGFPGRPELGSILVKDIRPAVETK